jgi:hypothetical protein
MNVSLSRFFVGKYNISGNTKPVTIGNSVNVQCGRSIQVRTELKIQGPTLYKILHIFF